MEDLVVKHVHVTGLYTQTARKAVFATEQTQTVHQVIDEAYHKL